MLTVGHRAHTMNEKMKLQSNKGQNAAIYQSKGLSISLSLTLFLCIKITPNLLLADPRVVRRPVLFTLLPSWGILAQLQAGRH